MIRPFWFLLIFKPEFVLWTFGLLVVFGLLSYAFVIGIFGSFSLLIPIALAIAIVFYSLRWLQYFLITLEIDYDARGGDGEVRIERLIPDLTRPESESMSLQEAMEGSPSVNTSGFINTVLSQINFGRLQYFQSRFKGVLTFLRSYTSGDLTFKSKTGNVSMTMYNIRNPSSVLAKLQGDWKKISDIKAREKAAREKAARIEETAEGVKKAFNDQRAEEIERMAIAVAEGLKRAQQEAQVKIVPAEPPPPPPQPPATPQSPPSDEKEKNK